MGRHCYVLDTEFKYFEASLVIRWHCNLTSILTQSQVLFKEIYVELLKRTIVRWNFYLKFKKRKL